MAILPVRRTGGQTFEPGYRWDPFQQMRELMRWEPFEEMTKGWLPTEKYNFTPAFEVKETKDAFIFKGDLPGMKEQDVEITLTGNQLSISGKREAELKEEKDKYYTYERSYGSFTRTFTLPEGIQGEEIRAEMKDGVLTLQVAKTGELLPKKIAVKMTEKVKA
jgi:HSP20 family protein